MAKHVGLIPSLDGGLYQVNGDKVEVQSVADTRCLNMCMETWSENYAAGKFGCEIQIAQI